MIGGKRREEVRTVPFFDHVNYPNNDHFWELPPILTVSEDPKNDEPYFDFDGFLDTLSAPFYLSQKADNQMEYFQKYFPDEDIYTFAINQHLENATASIDFKIPLQGEWNSINESLNETLKKLYAISLNLLSIKDERFQKLSAPSIEIVSKLIQVAKHCINKLQLLDKDIYDSYYYVSRKKVSWEKDPLAYFKNFFLSDGYKQVIEAYNNVDDDDYYDEEINTWVVEKETLFAFIHRILVNEYLESFSIIKNIISRNHGQKAQSYINDVKKQIVSLYNIAKDHPINESYKSAQRPLCLLSKRLEEYIPNYDWTMELECEQFTEPFIYKKRFLKKLRSAKLHHDLYGDISLLRNPLISTTYLEWFVRGFWNEVRDLDLNWKPTQVYFLLSLLEKYSKGETNFGLRDAASKFCIQGRPFNPRNYSSKRDAGPSQKRWWKPQIQDLFKQH